MTSAEKAQLDELLLKVASETELPSEDEPQGRPAGYIPEVCLKSFYKLTRTPFMELVIYRRKGEGYEYLYQNRHDGHWNGFCAFGGMVRANFPATPLGIAQKLVDHEFKGMGIVVRSLRIVSFLNWPEHPWCNPFAVVCLIFVDRDIPADGDRHWLSTDNLPEEMVVHHGRYLEQCDAFLRDGHLVFTTATPDGFLR